ncbi:TetR/AcrR family transcriptional regulator [Plantactinospora endophytica]|uniref:TetR family transcriptional regulator n=1 Tax=Plantactinospora endophytica TaxID=673535 RepID=A0ABQ4E7X9_9ACTN|nr:TetR/AcrR family transcriptional regulator [Plantactinospora endophytica]GIG90803.1 TetR family transcriptional regulator [Plantactinospora endophytica]
MSPRSERLNQELRARSRERILAAALEVFAEHGYESATISQVTERAQVSRGLVSYYFRTKEELLAAILDQWLSSVFTLLDGLDPAAGPDQRLRTVIDRVLTTARERLAEQRLMLCLMVQPSTRTTYARVERSRAAEATAFENSLREIFADRGAADPAVEEVLWRSMMEGVLFKLAVYTDSYPLDAVRTRLYQLYGLTETDPAPTAADQAAPIRLRIP